MKRRLVLAVILLSVLGGGWAQSGAPPTRGEPQAEGQFDPATLKPFTVVQRYLGKYETGLYPDGRNEMPEAHRKNGERLAAAIEPLDVDGRPDARKGRIIALVIGHSNCSMYFRTFKEQKLDANAAELRPGFELVSAANWGKQLTEWRQFDGKAWKIEQELLAKPGYSRRQVQVLFLHTTYSTSGSGSTRWKPPEPFPETMKRMQAGVTELLGHCAELYPNLKLAYLTADGFRHFSNREPHVWQEAFAFKWLIESQIKGEAGTAFEGKDRKLPWLCWGPYIWDNTWDRSYFRPDGVHPETKAREVFAEKYWDLLRADSVARIWMFKAAAPSPAR